MVMKFRKELYSKIALLKAAYNYLERAYIHLDADDDYYYVSIESKDGNEINEKEFFNEIMTQSVRHEVYQQTKNVRELLLARSFATSIVADESDASPLMETDKDFDEDEILKDWFSSNE